MKHDPVSPPAPLRPLTRDEVRKIDRRAIEELGLPGIVLMENAGRGAAELLVGLGIDGPVIVTAGKGNNGGDGFVIARHLEIHGFEVRVLLFADPLELAGDALTNYRVLNAAGTQIRNSAGADPSGWKVVLRTGSWIVDALLGTGTRGSVREPFGTAIEKTTAPALRVRAVVLRPGSDSATGNRWGRACGPPTRQRSSHP